MLLSTTFVPSARAGQLTIDMGTSCSSPSITGSAPNFTLTCSSTSTGGGGAGGGGTTSATTPTGCSISAIAVPSAGANITLNAFCGSGGPVTSWVWTSTNGMAAQTTTTAALSVNNVMPNTTFWAVPHTDLGKTDDLVGNVAGVVIGTSTTGGVTGGGTGGGGTGGGGTGGGGTTGLCSQYSNVVFMNLKGNVDRQDTITNGTPFQANGVLVASFTVPAGTAFSAGAEGFVSFAEFGDAPTFRQASLSSTACDFRGAATGANDSYTRDLTGVAPFPIDWGIGISGAIFWTVTGTSNGVAQLPPGTYYLNIRNWSPYNNGGQGGISCSTGTCNAIVTLHMPGF